MPAPLQLPDGLTRRPLTTDDTVGVLEVIAAQELDDVGEVIVEVTDIVADWQRPGYDVPTQPWRTALATITASRVTSGPSRIVNVRKVDQ